MKKLPLIVALASVAWLPAFVGGQTSQGTVHFYRPQLDGHTERTYHPGK